MVVTSINKAVESPELPLSVIQRELTRNGALAVLVIILSDLVQFFNVGKTMNDVQVAMTAELILQKYSYLKLEELKYCFQEAMCSGKVFDRLDGNIILGWLREYDMKRDEIVTQQSINEANAHKQDTASEGMFYSEYIALLKKKAEAGDEEAKARLELHAETSKRFSGENKEDKFRKWKEEYDKNGTL